MGAPGCILSYQNLVLIGQKPLAIVFALKSQAEIFRLYFQLSNHIQLKAQSMSKPFENVLNTIGNTPIIKINKLSPAGVNMFVKAEGFNPMGSVKDRMAVSTIEAAEASGELKPGQTVIEATSGNTGIGLAMVCAVKGYPLVVTMAESFSLERRKILRFLGARVVLTPAELKGSGMVAKAVELAETHGWFLVRQFENEANADAHSRTTAEEILSTFEDSSWIISLRVLVPVEHSRAPVGF